MHDVSQAMPQTAQTMPVLESVSSRLAELAGILNGSAQRLRKVNDRARGGRPDGQSSSNVPPRPVRGGIVGSIEDRIDDLLAVASLQSSEIEGLEKLV